MGDIHPLADQIVDQLSPTVNMLHVDECPEASLQTILEKNLDSESQGSMETATKTTAIQPPLPPFRGGRIFNVSVDSPPRDGETKEDHTACVNRSVNRA